MSIFLKKHYPLLISLATFWVVLFYLYQSSLALTQGHFTYNLDDPYIHMALAKNALFGHFVGILPGDFNFCSSSPLWTGIQILCYYVSGMNEFLPLILNIIIATILIFQSYILISSKIESKLIVLVVSGLLLFATPLPLLVFIGLEHLLHILLTLNFILLFSKITGNDTQIRNNRYHETLIVFVTPFLTTIRYEGIFAVAAAFILLIIYRKAWLAFAILCAGILPHMIIGLYSVAHGGLFFPSSILLKSDISLNGFGRTIRNWFYNFYQNTAETPTLLIILLTTLPLLALKSKKNNTISDRSGIELLLYFFIAILHLQFAKTNWFYRYEAYLIFLGIILLSKNLLEISGILNIGNLLSENRLKKIIFAVFIIIFLSPLINRGISSIYRIPVASSNIYEQQKLAAGFLSFYCKGESVALNDIGAAGLFTNNKIIDLWGIGNTEIARAKLGGYYDSSFISSVLRKNNVKMAVIYDDWFDGRLRFYKGWYKIATIRLPVNFSSGMEKTYWLAPDSLTAVKKAKELRIYLSDYPKNLIYSIYEIPQKEY